MQFYIHADLSLCDFLNYNCRVEAQRLEVCDGDHHGHPLYNGGGGGGGGGGEV